MSDGWIYVGAFTAATLMAFGFTPMALKFAVRKKILDFPGAYKRQESAIPYLGGVAIVSSFAIVVLVGALLRPLATFTAEVPLMIGCAVMLSIVGLVDDLVGLNPLIRFALETVAAVALFYAGIRVEMFGDLVVANLLLTVLWVVGVTNAFNLLDNMDGLSAGVGAIASLVFFILAAANQQVLVAALAIALAGCALGFLRHNFHPAKIYMGDAGSLFLGFMLAVIGLKLRFANPVRITFLVPILVLGVPIFDTVLVTASRLTHRLNPFAGGRDHTSHRLVFVGIPVRAAVALIYISAVGLGWLAICVSRIDVVTAYMLTGFVVLASILIGVMLARVPVYEKSKRRRMMLVEVARHDEDPSEREDDVVEATP